jgi:flavorubredoxin
MPSVQQIHPDVTAVSTFNDVLGVGMLAINSFVLHAEQPMIVDSGTTADSEQMVAKLLEVVDPALVRWLWITHTDADHIGGVHLLLDRCPNMSVITNFVGFVKMGTHAPIPLRRVHLLNPGEHLDLGDRTVAAIRPPLFDAPETMGIHDPVSGAFFSSDCFGGLLPLGVHSLDALAPGQLLAAQKLWMALDTPWVHSVDRKQFQRGIDTIAALEPSMILSGHLPPAYGQIDAHLAGLAAGPDSDPFVGPNQADLDAILGR